MVRQVTSGVHLGLNTTLDESLDLGLPHGRFRRGVRGVSFTPRTRG
jgi:hypothetical protein